MLLQPPIVRHGRLLVLPHWPGVDGVRARCIGASREAAARGEAATATIAANVDVSMLIGSAYMRTVTVGMSCLQGPQMATGGRDRRVPCMRTVRLKQTKTVSTSAYMHP